MQFKTKTNLRNSLLLLIRAKKVLIKAIVNGSLGENASCIVDLPKLIYFLRCIENKRYDELKDWKWSWPKQVVVFDNSYDINYNKAFEALNFLNRFELAKVKTEDLVKINESLTIMTQEIFTFEFGQILISDDQEVLQAELVN